MKIWGDLTMLAGRIRGLQTAVFGDEPPRSDDVSSGGGSGAVTSVAGRTGAIVLSHSDITDFSGNAISPSEKAVNNGVATLDSTGKVPTSQIPNIAITKISVVSSQANQLALTTEEGDVVVRTDLTKTYIRNSGVTGTMTDFTELLNPGGGSVVSVNGHSGVVVLTASDLTGFSSVATSGNYADLTGKPTHLDKRVLINNTASGAITIDWSLYDSVMLTLTGNVVLTFTNATAEQGCIIRFKQDATGGRTVTLPSTVRYGTTIASFTASIPANVIDRIGLIYDSIDAKYDLSSVLKGVS